MVAALFVYAQLPFVVIYNVITSPFAGRNKDKKTMRRVINDTIYRFLGTSLTVPQVVDFIGSTDATYEKWVLKNQMTRTADVFENGGRLLWLGPKRTQNVLLFCHGGGFEVPLQDFHLRYLQYLQQELKKKGRDVDVAVLEYSIAPETSGTARLAQLMSAVAQLLASGIPPKNLIMMGDSAGCNLVLQLLSHTLHPFEEASLPQSPLRNLSTKVQGVYLMSPWVSLSESTGSARLNSSKDVVTTELQTSMGRSIVDRAPKSYRYYLEINEAPEDWFHGVNNIVKNVLITSGDDECLYTDIGIFAERLSSNFSDKGAVEYFVQKHGIHDDPLQDFFSGMATKGLSDATPLVIEWLAKQIVS